MLETRLAADATGTGGCEGSDGDCSADDEVDLGEHGDAEQVVDLVDEVGRVVLAVEGVSGLVEDGRRVHDDQRELGP